GAGKREQAMLHVAHDLRGDGDPPLRKQVVGLVDAAGGGVLDGEERQVGGSLLHRLSGLAQRLIAGEKRSALAPAVVSLRGEMTVRALDALIGDAQRGGLEPSD